VSAETEEILLADLGVRDVLLLPDWALGQRMVDTVQAYSNAAAAGGAGNREYARDIIVWEFGWFQGYTMNYGTYFRVGLGEGAPATEAAMLGCEAFLDKLGRDEAQPARVMVDRVANQFRMGLRTRVAAANRRLVLWYNGGTTVTSWLTVWTVFSYVPVSLPRWAAKRIGLLE